MHRKREASLVRYNQTAPHYFFSVLTKFIKILRSSALKSSHISNSSSCSSVRSGRIPSPAKNCAIEIPNASQILSKVGTVGMLFLFIIFANAVCELCKSVFGDFMLAA